MFIVGLIYNNLKGECLYCISIGKSNALMSRHCCITTLNCNAIILVKNRINKCPNVLENNDLLARECVVSLMKQEGLWAVNGSETGRLWSLIRNLTTVTSWPFFLLIHVTISRYFDGRMLESMPTKWASIAVHARHKVALSEQVFMHGFCGIIRLKKTFYPDQSDQKALLSLIESIFLL